MNLHTTVPLKGQSSAQPISKLPAIRNRAFKKKITSNKEICHLIAAKLLQGPMTYAELYSWLNTNHPNVIKYRAFKQYVAKHFKDKIVKTAILKTTVKESVDEIEKLIRECKPFLRPRLQMLLLFKQEQPIKKIDLALKAGISYNSAVAWSNLYAKGGMKELLKNNREQHFWVEKRNRVFNEEIRFALENRHKVTPFKTYIEMHKWLKKNHKLEMRYPTFLNNIHAIYNGKLVTEPYIGLIVKESWEELEKKYSNYPSAVKPRIKMLLFLKNDKEMTISVLAERVGCTYGSIKKWCGLYVNGGLPNLLRPRLDSFITYEIHSFMVEGLKNPAIRNFAQLVNQINKDRDVPIRYGTLLKYADRNFKKEFQVMQNATGLYVKESFQQIYISATHCQVEVKPRLRMLNEIKKNPGISKDTLSIQMGIRKTLINRWCILYRKGGLSAILEYKRKGRKVLTLPDEVKERIEICLATNPKIKIVDIHRDIKNKCMTDLSYNKLYRYVQKVIKPGYLDRGARNVA